jgi:diguanylate cyclase (GGDEF)-like protein
MIAKPSSVEHELVPLADRLRYMQLFRFAVAVTVLAYGLLVPRAVGVPLGELTVGTAAYGLVSLLGGALWRQWRGRGLTLFGAMIIVDGVFLAWVPYSTGGISSPLRYLVFLHLIAVALLASHRTGLKLALWHSLLLFVVFHAQEAGILEPVGNGLRSTASEFQHLSAFVAAFWFVAIGTASFSAVNERELRRRKYDLEALARMAGAVEEATDPRAVAEVVVDSVVDTFGFTRAVLLRSVDDGVSVLAVHGREEPIGNHWFPGLDVTVAQACLDRKTVLVGGLDPAADPRLAELLPGARNLIVVPLSAEGRSVGAIVAEHGLRRGSRIERRVVTMVERFASHTALALRNAWLLEQVHKQAATDGLTGVANRRTFETALERELARARRAWGEVGLVLIDVDRFKQLNDAHGHQIGDDVLREVAATLARHCREYDTVARYGGEEFAVLLPGSGERESLAAAERFRRAIEEAETIVPVTVSAGVAVYPTHCSENSSLVKAADEALYESKRNGRNRVSSSSPPIAEVTVT